MAALLLISSAQKLPRFVVQNETKGAELIGGQIAGRFCETPNERNGVRRGRRSRLQTLLVARSSLFCAGYPATLDAPKARVDGAEHRARTL